MMELLVVVTDIVEKVILFVLFGLSIWSFSIIIDRYKLIRWQRSADQFSDLKQKIKLRATQDLSEVKDLNVSEMSFTKGAVVTILQAQQNSESISTALSSYTKEEKMKLEKGLAVLATLGSNAPFIGLFGTVLGIIRSFAYLGAQSGTATVMSGISQALFATAIGLFVAIPAVVAFNVFTKMIRDLMTQVESLRDLYISQLKG
jgi:biopolymer transport protein ExbB